MAILAIGVSFSYFWYTSSLPKQFKVNNLEGGVIRVLGHGGDGIKSRHGLNSKQSFQKALNEGVKGTEIDIQMTLDGHLVAYHDYKLSNASSCSGNVAAQTWKSLSGCLTDDGPILDLPEVLDLNWPVGSIMSLDVKLHSEDSVYLKNLGFAIKSIQLRYQFSYRFLIESNSLAFLQNLKDLNLNADLFYYCHNPQDGLAANSTFIDGISIENSLISSEEVTLLHNLNKRVMIWGVGSSWDNRKAVLKSPDFIQTDNIRHLQRLLKN